MRKTWMTTLRRVFDDDDDDGDETTVVGRGEPRRGRVRGDRGDVCAEYVAGETRSMRRKGARRLTMMREWIMDDRA